MLGNLFILWAQRSSYVSWRFEVSQVEPGTVEIWESWVEARCCGDLRLARWSQGSAMWCHVIWKLGVSQVVWRFDSHESRLAAEQIWGHLGGAMFRGNLRSTGAVEIWESWVEAGCCGDLRSARWTHVLWRFRSAGWYRDLRVMIWWMMDGTSKFRLDVVDSSRLPCFQWL